MFITSSWSETGSLLQNYFPKQFYGIERRKDVLLKGAFNTFLCMLIWHQTVASGKHK